ncbi:MAG: DUF1559 domain-containing protein [Abditibacteriota bacterium]|nr:DUF1559 domain-containing protein [Abditibacteriota bacterium]
MNTRNKFMHEGFTLIELLTVIAIIAILSAIIFPVMKSISEQTDRTACTSNLKEIGVALGMYHADNGRYPAGLAPDVEYDGDGNPKGIAASRSNLFANDYLANSDAFHCPSDVRFEDKYEVVKLADRDVYAYSSYEVYINDAASFDNIGTDNVVCYNAGSNPVKQYALSWSEDEDAAGTDYARQLKWKNPPSSTVVCWCMNHADYPYAQDGTAKGKSLVLFLDGHVDLFNDVSIVADNAWKVKPIKE